MCVIFKTEWKPKYSEQNHEILHQETAIEDLSDLDYLYQFLNGILILRHI